MGPLGYSGKPHGGKQSAITVWGEFGWVRMYPGEDDELPLELYSMQNVDTASAMEILDTLL